MTSYQEKVMEVRDKINYLIQKTGDYEKFRYKLELLFFIGVRFPEDKNPLLYEMADEIDNLIEKLEENEKKEVGKWFWM